LSGWPETFSRYARWRIMTDDPGTLRARLYKLAALVELARLSRSEEDRARMERSIQLVSWALQAVARARRQRGDPALQCEAVEVEALCRRIVAEARAAGLRIGDNDNW
jgi:Xaa-Pro aminopeptidase